MASRKAGQPERRAVMGPAGIERSLGGFAHVDRRIEVGLADLQVDDIDARRLQRLGPCRGFEGRLRAEVAHPLRHPHGRMLAGPGGAARARPGGQGRGSGHARIRP